MGWMKTDVKPTEQVQPTTQLGKALSLLAMVKSSDTCWVKNWWSWLNFQGSIFCIKNMKICQISGHSHGDSPFFYCSFSKYQYLRLRSLKDLNSSYVAPTMLPSKIFSIFPSNICLHHIVLQHLKILLNLPCSTTW